MHKRHYLALALIALPVLAQAGDSRVEIGTGLASYYGAELSGNRTASGERFDRGHFQAQLDIRRDGRLLWHERQRIVARKPLTHP